MTVRKGQEWGSVGPLPAGAVRIHSDAELHQHVDRARRDETAIAPVALLGGALMRAVGGSGDPTRLEREVPLLPVDLVRVELDDAVAWATTHVVARRSWWRGEVIAAMNGQFLGDWDVAPRAHPNDGRIDLVRVRAAMSWRDRWRARSRLPSGTHVPHPAIETRQVSAVDLRFEHPIQVWADGVPLGPSRRVSLVVEPDAFTVSV